MALASSSDRDLRAELLLAVRDNKPKEAMRLLRAGAGVDFRDQTGYFPLHYAAEKCFIDVIDLLLQNGAETFAWDEGGQTALHKAAMQGHVRAIVALIARGARLDIIDRKGKLPLEYAIENKRVATVELLCQFGSELLLIDWSWIQDKDLERKPNLYAIAQILKRHQMRMSGYKHGGIWFDVAVIIPGKDTMQLPNTGVEVKVAEGQEPYYLYLSQTEEVYGKPPTLDAEENVFGHLLQCQAWGSRVKIITLTVTVDQALLKNEEVVLRPSTKISGVDKVEVVQVQGAEGKELRKVTRITITVPMTSEIYHVAIAKRDKKEVFKISDEAVTLKPEVEPDAEITIPANTFKSGDLSIKFADTTYVNEEIKENEEPGRAPKGPLLMTNVLDLTTSDGQQPDNAIKMKIPVATTNKLEELVVLTTSNPDPNLDEWVWETIPVEKDRTGKAVFNIGHFSVITVASMAKFRENNKSVKNGIRQSCLKMRYIIFSVMVKKPYPDAIKTDVVVICGTKHKTEKKRRDLRKKNSYDCFGTLKTFAIPEGQWFQIRFHGNVKEATGDDHLAIQFTSESFASSRTFEIRSTESDPQELNGSVEILAENKFNREVEEVRQKGIFCFKWTETMKVQSKDYATRTEGMTTIPFKLRFPKTDTSIDKDLDRKDLCIIPALRWKNLSEAMKGLEKDAALQLGSQLIRQPELNQIQKQSSDTNLAFNILRKWRLRLPGQYQADELMRALRAIGKDLTAEWLSSLGLQEQHYKGGEDSDE